MEKTRHEATAFEHELHCQAMIYICKIVQKIGTMYDEDVAATEKIPNEKYHPIFHAA